MKKPRNVLKIKVCISFLKYSTIIIAIMISGTRLSTLHELSIKSHNNPIGIL